MEKKKSQKEIILEWMQMGNSITELDAILEFGCGHLAGRIKELKDAGHDIRADRIEVVKKSGGYANIARYSLNQPKQEKKRFKSDFLNEYFKR